MIKNNDSFSVNFFNDIKKIILIYQKILLILRNWNINIYPSNIFKQSIKIFQIFEQILYVNFSKRKLNIIIFSDL